MSESMRWGTVKSWNYACTCGWANGKLSALRQGYAVAIANGLDAAHALDDRIRRGAIVLMQPALCRVPVARMPEL